MSRTQLSAEYIVRVSGGKLQVTGRVAVAHSTFEYKGREGENMGIGRYKSSRDAHSEVHFFDSSEPKLLQNSKNILRTEGAYEKQQQAPIAPFSV